MIKKIKEKITTELLIAIGVDLILIWFAYYFSYWLRFGGAIPELYLSFFFNSLPMVLLVKIYFINDFGLHRISWKYTSIEDVASLFKATVISTMGMVLVIWISGLIEKLPRTVIVIDWCLCFIMLGGIRIVPRMFLSGVSEPIGNYPVYFLKNIRKHYSKNRANLKNVLIYGAGDAGEMIVREMKLNNALNYNPIGFIDDNKKRKGKAIHGIKILGTKYELSKIIEKKKVDEIIISLATAPRKEIKEIIRICEETNITIKIIPSISEIVDGKVNVSNIREIKLEDLLGREPIVLDTGSISKYIKGKNILVTGAGGSIGSELCRQIMKFSPKSLILFGRGENSIFEIHSELHAKFPDTNFPQVIGDVINKAKVEKVFEAFHPDIIFHAGADKHVPLMEMNPDEAVLNNIVGTRNIIETSDAFGVEKVICISTDKAVNPTSMMGVCKRVAEKIIHTRKAGKTNVMGVRFGNVLGSRGSVVPLFERQILNGGPVTVTHKDMTRFLMTIPEATQLVLQAGAIGKNGDQFVLDMGEPVIIDELARTMIKLAGLKPDEDIEIKYSGVRPGEKLYEELVCSCESSMKTEHPKLIKIIDKQEHQNGDQLLRDVDELKRLAVEMDYDGIYAKLSAIIPEYQPEEKDSRVCFRKAENR